MAISPDQVLAQFTAAAKALEKISQKEREQKPTKGFGENYNTLLALAKESMPDVDGRLWPPVVPILQPSAGPSSADCKYIEVSAFYNQIIAILEEGAAPPFAGIRG